MTTLRRGLAGAALVVTALAMTGCTGGGGDSESATAPVADSGAVAREKAPGLVDGTAADAAAQAGAGTGVGSTLVELRSVVRTGEVAVTRASLDAARADLDEVLARLDGFVQSESTEHDRAGRIRRSTVVVRVPVDRFTVAMTEIERLGRARHSDVDTQDVTTQVIDVDERVETLENSLDRLQGYQEQAQDIDDLLRYEQQITEREAELQSLRSQQAYLHDQTSMSTITVHLARPASYAPPPGALDEAGFVAGLQSGWDALKGTVVVMLTVVGAVIPFLFVLLLVGLPTWLLVRRAVRSRGTEPSGTSDVPAEQ